MSARYLALLTIFALFMPLLIGCGHKVTDPGDSYGEHPLSPSEGLIPMSVGNWWDYQVRSYNPDTTYTVRRKIRAVHTLGPNQYYMFVDSAAGSSHLDTLYFLRNIRNIGVMAIMYPPDSALTEDTLFWWPHVHAGYHYWFGQDSMLVLYDEPGFDLPTDTLGPIMSYQRFVNGSRAHYYTYNFLGDTIGLLSEYDNSEIDPEYTLTAYHVVH